MNARVYRQGELVYKPLRPATSAAEALTLCKLTARLRAAGVTTPPMRFFSAQRIWVFPHLAGQNAKQFCAHMIGAAVAADRPAALINLLTPCFSALAKLHICETAPSMSCPYDWETKVKTHLAEVRDKRLGDAANNVYQTLSGLDQLQPGTAPGSSSRALGLVHGDLHLGQWLVQNNPPGRWVLLDLEDIARGPAEIDLGNFVSHLVTTSEYAIPLHWTHDVAQLASLAYPANGRRQISPELLKHFLARSLLRRALKLHTANRIDTARCLALLHLATDLDSRA